MAVLAPLLSVAAAIASTPPTFTTLATYPFNDAIGSLVQGADGNLYGASWRGNGLRGGFHRQSVGALHPQCGSRHRALSEAVRSDPSVDC